MTTPDKKELKEIEDITKQLVERYKELLTDYYRMSLEIDALRKLVFNEEDLPKTDL